MDSKKNIHPPHDDEEQTERDYCIPLKVPDVLDENGFLARSIRDIDDVFPNLSQRQKNDLDRER